SYVSQNASNTLSVTITQAVTTTAVVGAPSVITSGGSVTLTATVTSTSNSAQGPTGTIQFKSGGANVGTPVTCTQKGAVLNSSGTMTAGASCTATFSTTLATLPPLNFDNRVRRTPFEWFATLLAALAIVLCIRTIRVPGARRAYGYAAITLFFVATAILAGC